MLLLLFTMVLNFKSFIVVYSLDEPPGYYAKIEDNWQRVVLDGEKIDDFLDIDYFAYRTFFVVTGNIKKKDGKIVIYCNDWLAIKPLDRFFPGKEDKGDKFNKKELKINLDVESFSLYRIWDYPCILHFDDIVLTKKDSDYWYKRAKEYLRKKRKSLDKYYKSLD